MIPSRSYSSHTWVTMHYVAFRSRVDRWWVLVIRRGTFEKKSFIKAMVLHDDAVNAQLMDVSIEWSGIYPCIML